MKKLIYFVCSLFLVTTTLFLSSCGDNKDFSSEHVLTDEELAEMARQDSIKQARMNMINADLILTRSLDITISSTAYDGGTVDVNIDSISALFGLSNETILAVLSGEDTSTELNGFAIDGSTHTDVSSASNTNAKWGHWWSAAGDVTTWGDNAMVFAEFDPEKAVFNVGQFPGHLTDGQTVTFIECLKYQDLRFALVITVNAKARGEVEAGVVNTQKLTLTTTPKNSYDADVVEGFDLNLLMSDLGVSSTDELSWIAVNADGSYAQEATADAPGFWYDMEGYASSWGDNASVYCGFYENQIQVGQYPNHNEAGSQITIYYGATANNKIEMLEITINFQEYDDPETAPEGDPVSFEKDITITKAYSNDYATVTYEDLQDELRNAFKMTTYQIYKAILSGDLKVYVQESSEEAPTYTADAPGYWINADGNSSAWAEGVVWLSISYSETALTLYGGNHPDNCSPAGQAVTTKYIIVCNGVTATYNVTFNITEKEQ